MKRAILFLLALVPVPAFAQTAALPLQQCVANASQAIVSGLKSTNYLQGVIPSCTVTIYLTGTQTLATYYLSHGGSPQTGPFTASSTGQWLAYAATGVGYDVVLSGGIPPNTYPAPVTFTDIFAGGGGGGGGGVLEIIPGQNITCSPNDSGSCTGNVTINSTAGIDACSYSGSDLGAKIIAAYTANPAPALIIVRSPCASWTTPISLPIGDSLYIQAGNYTLPGGNKLLGSNRVYGDGFSSTTLTLQANDSIGEMWQMSDGNTFSASNVAIDSLTLNGNRANQTVTGFGVGLVTIAQSGTYVAGTNSNIQIAAQFIQCKVDCIASVTNENQPLVNGIVLTGSHINGAGQAAVYLQGVNAPVWVGVDIQGWGLETANNDAIFSTGQVGTGGIGQPCPFTPLGGQWIGGIINNTGNATKFAIEETSFGPGCELFGGTIKGITSYGAPNGGVPNGAAGNGFSVGYTNGVIEGNSLIPPPGVTQVGDGGMELAIINSVVSNNTIIDGEVTVAGGPYFPVFTDDQFIGNVIKPGLVPNPIALSIGGGGSSAVVQNFTIVGGDIDLTGWTGVTCTAINIGSSDGTTYTANNIKIEGVNIHQDSGISLPITSGSISGDVFFATGSFTGLVAGTQIEFKGFTGPGAVLNGLTSTVSATGLSSTQFQAPVTTANVASTGAGSAAGELNTCHGIYAEALDGSQTLQVRDSTFTNLMGAFGDQVTPPGVLGMTDIDFQDNTLRGNTPVYDNTAPVPAVNIRVLNPSLQGSDTNEYLNGYDYVDNTGFITTLNGIGSGDPFSIPQTNLEGWYAASAVCPNASLSSWTDLSGNGNTLTAGGATYGTCVASDINGYPAVRFVNGTTYPYVNTAIAWPFSGYNETVFVVHKKTIGTAGVVYDGGPPCYPYPGNCAAGDQTGFMKYGSATSLVTGSAANNISATVADDGLWHLDVIQQSFLVPNSTINSLSIWHDGTKVASTPTVVNYAITSWSITSNVVTFQGSFTGLTSGTVLSLSLFGTSIFFNGQNVTVSATGLSSTQFEATFTHANGSATEAGTASTFIGAAGLSGISIGGANYSTLSQTTSGDIAEVIAYSSELTSSQVLSIETYLAYKYGLTIAGAWTMLNGALQNTSVQTGSVIDTGVATSPSTSAICPNGTGGAFTTSGCVASAGGTVSGQANGTIPLATGATTIGAQSPLSVVSGNVASSDPITSPNVCPQGAYGSNGIFCIDAAPSTGIWGGAYSSGTSYANCTVVTYSGNAYIQTSLTAQTGVTPGTWPWEVLPTSTTFTSGLLPTQVDCADWDAVGFADVSSPAQIAASPSYQNPTLIAGAKVYTTNSGLWLRPVGATSSAIVSIVGQGTQATFFKAGSSIAWGTIYMQDVIGANSIGNCLYKDFQAVSNGDATFAFDFIGNHNDCLFQNLSLVGDQAHPAAQIGSPGTNNGVGFQDRFDDLQFNGGNISTVPTGTISGSTPTYTAVTAGSGLDNYLVGTVFGNQSGTSNVPCTTMGTNPLTVGSGLTLSGGALSAVSLSGYSGCSGNVYIAFWDGGAQYQVRFGAIGDSTFTHIVATGGYEAGVRFDKGEPLIENTHAYNTGRYGVEFNGQPSNMSGTDIDQIPVANIALLSNTSLNFSGGTYVGAQETGTTMFYLEDTAYLNYAGGIHCYTHQTNAFDTITTPSGTADNTNQALLLGTYIGNMHSVEYCGTAASGATINTGLIPTFRLASTPLETTSTGNATLGYITIPANAMGPTSHLQIQTSVMGCTSTANIPTSACTGTANTGICGIQLVWATASSGSGGVNLFGSAGYHITAASGSTIFTDIQNLTASSQLIVTNAAGAGATAFTSNVASFATTSPTYLVFQAYDGTSGQPCFITGATAQVVP